MENKRKLVAALFLAAVLAGTISCSSNDKKDESASADVAEATSDAGAPADGSDPNAPPADGSQASADAPPPADNAQAAPADPNAPPADADAAALDAPPPTDPTKAPESGEGDMAAADNPPPADPNSPPPGTDAAATTPPPAADDTKVADNSATTPPPPTDDTAVTPPPADTTSAGTGADAFGAAAASDAAAPAPKKRAKLAHIKDAPFTKGGQNLNTVYIARDGDTLDSISQKLFGEDKTKQLAKANPTLKKGVKTGDKVYFNSPNRPDDKEKMLTVYEDQGLPPTPYTTKDGDTLKSLAQEWYGAEDSYKEIYAVNKNVTSTKDLPAGTELQYWPASVAVSAYSAKKDEAVAQAPPPPTSPQQPPPGMNPPGTPPGGAPGMPGAPNMANNGNPPGMNPPGAPGAAGTMGGPGAPGAPGQPPGMAPPPPTDIAAMPKPHNKPKDLSASGGGMDKDTVFYAGVAGILLVASALWFALRRRRSRNSGVTQI